MDLKDVVIGEKYTYYPPRENAEDNRHFPARVEAIGKRVRVVLFFEGAEAGRIRSVSAARLRAQGDLPGVPS